MRKVTSIRQAGRVQMGVGSTICLASTFGLHPAKAEDSVDKLSEVTVTGRPAVSTYGTTFQDTPQNVTVVTQQELLDQAVNTVQDALKNVPGITLNAGEGGTHGDNINLRGFAASDDFFLDGLRDTGFYTRDSFNLEGLEVYKGPASTLFGRGSTGGVVNQVSKGTSPAARWWAGPTASCAAPPMSTTPLDGRRHSASMPWASDRKSPTGTSSATAAGGVAPSVTFGLNRPTSLTLEYLHQEQNDVPDYGIPIRLRPAGAGAAQHLLWPAERRSQPGARRHRHRPVSRRTSARTCG